LALVGRPAAKQYTVCLVEQLVMLRGDAFAIYRDDVRVHVYSQKSTRPCPNQVVTGVPVGPAKRDDHRISAQSSGSPSVMARAAVRPTTRSQWAISMPRLERRGTRASGPSSSPALMFRAATMRRRALRMAAVSPEMSRSR